MTDARAFNSLQTFLDSNRLTVGGQVDAGNGEFFRVRGRSIVAAVLFADISNFVERTQSLHPAETLIFVQNFFAWITSNALSLGTGIVDKYIGDAVMVIFSKEFGSDDPFVDAVQAAIAMSRHDPLGYYPHMGIAEGDVMVAEVGMGSGSAVSVFGQPVNLAARCASIKPDEAADGVITSIAFPAASWVARGFGAVMPSVFRTWNGSFEVASARRIDLKGLGEVEIGEIHNTGLWLPMQTAEARAKEALGSLLEHQKRVAERANRSDFRGPSTS